METCDICRIEFTSSKPNKAVADTRIKGLGMWGFVCQAHLDHGVPAYTTMLDQEEGA